MIPATKFREIAQGLLDKTRAGKLPWERGQTDTSGFHVHLPGSIIRIEYVSPSTEPDYVVTGFHNLKGEEAGRWFVRDGEEDWELASTLYKEAHKTATGWDKVVADIERFLSEK